ncbi:hypothetical protein [Desulfosediminicola flagellatus]|uniref:hypothetical protein n=1 Tax=Desulfosediminicola flagellatus TaxID=2569541 RepID=UPI0012947B45|nr:hypothetical protein [Desulfosediminicola flagellatus]
MASSWASVIKKATPPVLNTPPVITGVILLLALFQLRCRDLDRTEIDNLLS